MTDTDPTAQVMALVERYGLRRYGRCSLRCANESMSFPERCDHCEEMRQPYPEPEAAIKQMVERLSELQAALDFVVEHTVGEGCYTLPNGDCVGVKCMHTGDDSCPV